MVTFCRRNPILKEVFTFLAVTGYHLVSRLTDKITGRTFTLGHPSVCILVERRLGNQFRHIDRILLRGRTVLEVHNVRLQVLHGLQHVFCLRIGSIINRFIIRNLRKADGIGSIQLFLQLFLGHKHFIHFRLHELPVELGILVSCRARYNQRADGLHPSAVRVLVHTHPRVGVSRIAGVLPVSGVVGIDLDTVKPVLLRKDVPQDMSLLVVVHKALAVVVRIQFMEAAIRLPPHHGETVGFGSRIVRCLRVVAVQFIIHAVAQRHFLAFTGNNQCGLIISPVVHELLAGHMVNVIHFLLAGLDCIKIRSLKSQRRVGPLCRPQRHCR